MILASYPMTTAVALEWDYTRYHFWALSQDHGCKGRFVVVTKDITIVRLLNGPSMSSDTRSWNRDERIANQAQNPTEISEHTRTQNELYEVNLMAKALGY